MDPSTMQASASLIEKMTQLSLQPHSECTIYRVHTHLRNINPKAYEPEVVAIGPYHRDNDHLKMMEDLKLLYLQQIIKKKPSNNVESYAAAVGKVEAKARKCYADQPSSLSASDFIEMLVLDGCFIIQLVRKCKMECSKLKDDPIFEMDWMFNSVQRDLMLFENQVPFFVLCKLYDLIEAPNQHSKLRDLLLNFFRSLYPWKGHTEEANVVAPHEVQCSRLRHLLLDFFSSLYPWKGHTVEANVEEAPHKASNSLDPALAFDPRKVKHLLDLIHRSWFPPRDERKEVKKQWRFINGAARLREANVKFKRSEKDTLFDVEFKDGVMLMPPLIIEDNTESIFRNLIAYEQYFQHNFVTDYVKFLDCLVDSSKDVEILSRNGIVENWLGDEEVVAQMVNKLVDYVTVSGNRFIYGEMYNNVNEHCRKRRNKWMAKLRRNYFNNPWAIISVVVALVLLLLTITQTVFSIIQVVL